LARAKLSRTKGLDRGSAQSVAYVAGQAAHQIFRKHR